MSTSNIYRKKKSRDLLQLLAAKIAIGSQSEQQAEIKRSITIQLIKTHRIAVKYGRIPTGGCIYDSSVQLKVLHSGQIHGLK